MEILPEARARLDGSLLTVLEDHGPDGGRPLVVLAEVTGCMDVTRYNELRARGANLQYLTGMRDPAADTETCTTRFSFMVLPEQLPTIAMLPWLVRLVRDVGAGLN